MQKLNLISTRKILTIIIITIFILVPTSQALLLTKNNTIDFKKSNNGFLDTNNLISEVNQTIIEYYLKKLVEIGPRYTGTQNCKIAANYIYDEFNKLGLDVNIQNWKYLRYQCRNVVATKNGTDKNSDAVIVICAHYDTITWTLTKEQSVGANDDGSGVAAMLAIAKACSKYNFSHTIRFIAVSGEEVGTYGSFHYAKNAYKKGENIIAAICPDTIGYANNSINGKYLKMMIPQRSKWLFDIGKNVSLNYASYFNIKPLEMPHAPADDHSFMEFGYDNCLFIQSAPATVIHSPQDTIENINFSYLTNVTKFILCFTTELANKNINLQVRITKPEEGSIYILKNKIINLPGFNTRKIGLRGLTIILGSAEVQINITSDEEILCVDYSIDGFYVGSSNKSPYNWKISGLYLRLFGKKTLGVRVTAISGKAAYDEMDIFIIKPNLNIWKLFPQRERWK